MEEEKKKRNPLRDAPGYEICFLPTDRRREYRMGLWNSRTERPELEMIYVNLAEDRIWFADGTMRLLLHTTRRLQTGEYRYGCFEPGKGWLAEGEHLHLERILISEGGDRKAKTFWLWVYDDSGGNGIYRHRLYDSRNRMIGSFTSLRSAREPYEEIEYQKTNDYLVFREKKAGRLLLKKYIIDNEEEQNEKDWK
ncbi:MAG TPA: hypothetical protein H9761_16235 [Candidatus Eisenbergiella merdavium]|uniref:Uncharacterized protein n=1 Tax=Candidatus Eisenbergiella merdavium TaxID=2838551 RepID=A0A9D2NI28_9FIRM|nr:hypothetical protein [Candidatus Eisenbergiella merdavium]